MDVTCLVVYDGNRAKIGGEIKTSNDPTLPAGGFAWFRCSTPGEGANALPDRSSLIGFGDEAANEAFCSRTTCRGSDRGTSTATRRSTPRRYPQAEGAATAAPSLPSSVTVRDNPELQRYEAIVDGELAGSILYRELDDALILVHTEVEEGSKGRGSAAASLRRRSTTSAREVCGCGRSVPS